MNSYYQTTPIENLAAAEKVAVSQEQEIYLLMRNEGGAWDCWKLKDKFPHWEMTSIRRALFNLEKKQDKITQVGFVNGRKGKPVGSYTVVYSGRLFE